MNISSVLQIVFTFMSYTRYPKIVYPHHFVYEHTKRRKDKKFSFLAVMPLKLHFMTVGKEFKLATLETSFENRLLFIKLAMLFPVFSCGASVEQEVRLEWSYSHFESQKTNYMNTII